MRVCGHLVVIKEEQRLELNKKNHHGGLLRTRMLRPWLLQDRVLVTLRKSKKDTWLFGLWGVDGSRRTTTQIQTHTHTDDKKCHCHLESHRFCRRLRSSAPACNKPSIQSAGCESGEVVADTVLYVKSWVAAFSAICSCKLYVLYISFCQIMTFWYHSTIKESCTKKKKTRGS